MTALLEIKQRMKEFYAKYDIYIIPACEVYSGNGGVRQNGTKQHDHFPV